MWRHCVAGRRLTPLIRRKGTKVCRYSWHSAGSRGWPFPVLKCQYIFTDKIYGSNFIEQHSETVIVLNYQGAVYSLRKKFYCDVCYNFLHTLVAYWLRRRRDSFIHLLGNKGPDWTSPSWEGCRVGGGVCKGPLPGLFVCRATRRIELSCSTAKLSTTSTSSCELRTFPPAPRKRWFDLFF